MYGEYNTFTRCLLQDKFNLGATLVVWLAEEKPAHHTISYNYFLNRQNGPQSDNGLESMRIGDSKTSFTNAHCVVAFNRFEKCDGEIEIISNKSCHNSYFQNTFYNSDGGLTLRHGNDCLVDGNFFNGEFKKYSYGVRFIGQGHVAINNYFFQLGGAPNHVFRAPLTIVNGLVNTPINGYFQVRRAVVTDNIFVDCIAPNIRVGAFSKREGMTVVPDTISIRNNLFFTDQTIEGNIYEELSAAKNITIANNKICSNSLTANVVGIAQLDNKNSKRDGFDWIKDGTGKIIASVKQRAETIETIGVGADWVEPDILKEVSKRKYTYLSAKEVGPLWMK